jgi:hypothetical protein
MSAPLVFMDTETTGLSLDDDIWEFAAIRREPDGTETELHLLIQHARAKCERLPQSFREDHEKRWSDVRSVPADQAALSIHDLFTHPHSDVKPHVVGAVPNFDTERLAAMLTAFGFAVPWHYHLIDVENLAVGYLAGRASHGDLDAGLAIPFLPWKSDDLAAALGVTITEDERHTARGDARWAMRIYDAVMGGAA